MRLINRLFLALLSCALSVGVFAQTQDSTVVAAKDSVAPKKTKVFLEHANTLSFDKERNAEAQVLNGDVCFRHDSSYMYCDSAYFFEQTNSLEAFSNVPDGTRGYLVRVWKLPVLRWKYPDRLFAGECPHGEWAGYLVYG